MGTHASLFDVPSFYQFYLVPLPHT